MLAEQYLSWLRAIARSTAAAGMPLPRHGEVHVDLGEDLRDPPAARSAVSLTRAAAHVVPAALEDQHHVVGGAAAGAGQHGFHRPRRQVAARRSRAWPRPARRPSPAHGRCRFRPRNPCPNACRSPPVQLTVHSIVSPFLINALARTIPLIPATLRAQSDSAVLRSQQDSAILVSQHSDLRCAPVVSSTSPLVDLAPGSQGPGAFFVRRPLMIAAPMKKHSARPPTTSRRS